MRHNANMRNKIDHHQLHEDNVPFPGTMLNSFISSMCYLKDFGIFQQNQRGDARQITHCF